ncbi:hypothetical protein KG089_02305 [Carnobacteriaceae bacterium zg-ZUI252]|nr:hypothetical protein [Carnobacteriaceae bacterium zg-ZUI252]
MTSKNKKMTSGHKGSLRSKSIVSSLLLCTVLLSNVSSVYAESGVSDVEREKINAFLETKPENGASKTIFASEYVLKSKTDHGQLLSDATNYESFAQKNMEKTKLSADQVYLVPVGTFDYRKAKIKDVDTITVYRYQFRGDDYYYFKRGTLVYQDDFSEEEINNGGISLINGELVISRYRYLADLPISKVEYLDLDRFMFFNGYSEYWSMPVTNLAWDITYDTIVSIDESLKSGEILVDEEGKKGAFLFSYTPKLDFIDKVTKENYKKFTEAKIYEDINASLEKDGVEKLHNGEFNSEFDWGTISYTSTEEPAYENNSIEYVDDESDPIVHDEYYLTQPRKIRVGIDYTHFETVDGVELSSKVYGLKEATMFDGYELLETKELENGDRVHVYRLAVKDSDKYTPEGGGIIVPKGTMITEKDIFEKVTIPEGSNGILEVIGKIPETDTAGDKAAVLVRVTYPDNSTDVVEVTVKVTEVVSNEDVTKNTETEKTEGSVSPGNDVLDSQQEKNNVQNDIPTDAPAKVLPQTGESKSGGTMHGIAAISFGLLTFIKSRRKENR